MFERATSAGNATVGAHHAIFQSKVASKAIVRGSRAPTLAGILQDAGYATYGIADDNEWLNARYGYARGFQRYRQLAGGAERKVQEILDGIDDWVEQPFFLFAHFYDVHSDWDQLPYDSEPADLERLAGWYEGDWTGCDGERGCASRLLAELNATGEGLDEKELLYLEDLYDAGVATFDRKLGVLLDGLEAAGRFDDSVIIITADHGEEFFEHGKALHGQHYDECLRVPFLVRLPGGERQVAVVDELVGLVDITPTLLEAAGLDAATSLVGTQGRSVLPLTQGQAAEPRLGVLLDSGNGVFGLRTREHSVLHGATDWELYDVAADPGQSASLLPDGVDPKVSDDLRLMLKAMREETEAFAAEYPDGLELEDFEAEQADRMADLGYLGDEDPVEVR
ncbi:MAG: sulfatase-like hydrolase/transferase, partial [Proteobacteria bacterium]|nr:sulfatase-like hydrolase/transferase [Pseudomonadota bacterium]